MCYLILYFFGYAFPSNLVFISLRRIKIFFFFFWNAKSLFNLEAHFRSKSLESQVCSQVLNRKTKTLLRTYSRQKIDLIGFTGNGVGEKPRLDGEVTQRWETSARLEGQREEMVTVGTWLHSGIRQLLPEVLQKQRERLRLLHSHPWPHFQLNPAGASTMGTCRHPVWLDQRDGQGRSEKD